MVGAHLTPMSVILRPMQPDDLPRLAEVFAASFASHGHTVVTTAEELSEELQPPYCDMTTDAVVALENGRIIGGAYTLHLPASEGEVRCYIEGKVDPDAAGRGAGGALLDWGLTRAAELLADAVATLLGARGLRPVRWFSTLLRPLSDVPLSSDPPGIRIVTWDAERSGETLAVSNASFVDHLGSAPMLPEGWTQRTTGFGAHPATDTRLMTRRQACRSAGSTTSALFPGTDGAELRPHLLPGRCLHTRTVGGLTPRSKSTTTTRREPEGSTPRSDSNRGGVPSHGKGLFSRAFRRVSHRCSHRRAKRPNGSATFWKGIHDSGGAPGLPWAP